MRKNDLVQFTQVVKEDIADRYRHDESDGVVGGFRSLTWEEREVWTTKHNEAVRAGHTTWYDSAGEGKLAPMTESVSFPLNGVFIVLKARTTAYRGYGKTKGLTSIACPSTGRVGFVKRSLLEKVGEQ
tara:strand:- start:263 stop:646 length:384 start_codon:yes stop_codon:yes gene_type:complete